MKRLIDCFSMRQRWRCLRPWKERGNYYRFLLCTVLVSYESARFTAFCYPRYPFLLSRLTDTTGRANTAFALRSMGHDWHEALEEGAAGLDEQVQQGKTSLARGIGLFVPMAGI